MDLNIDSAIFIGFLAITMFIGLMSSRGTTTIKQYSIGDRNFSTATIVATIVATWISGSYFSLGVSESYKEGVWFIITGGGDIIGLLIVGFIFAPRMAEFLGQISVAESMGGLYGRHVRIITAIASTAHAIGKIALQIKVFSTVFTHFYGFSSDYATFISSIIVIAYSAWGGIKSVTFTDIIQFLTFGVFIPTLALCIWQAIDQESTMKVLHSNISEAYEEISFSNPKFISSFFLFLYFLIPGMSASTFQRVLMAKNTNQIGRSFIIAALICLCIHLACCFIGVLVAIEKPGLNPNNVAMYIIDNYSLTPALKGLAIAGIIAMVMSTADSWINTGGVIFTNDLCKPLGIKFKNDLTASRIFSVLIGTVSVVLALSASSLLNLILLRANFYVPIVSPALILAILGFRSNSRSVLIGMFFGASTVVIWKNFVQPSTGVDSVIPAMCANFVTFIFSHYFLKKSESKTFSITDKKKL